MRSRELIEDLHEKFCGNMEQFRYNKYLLEVLLDIRYLVAAQACARNDEIVKNIVSVVKSEPAPKNK